MEDPKSFALSLFAISAWAGRFLSYYLLVNGQVPFHLATAHC